MTYNVFGGMLNLALFICLSECVSHRRNDICSFLMTDSVVITPGVRPERVL